MPILASFMVPHPPLIVPDIGGGRETQVSETIRSYDQVGQQIAKLAPETIIITSPHAILYSDYFHISPGKNAKGSFAMFRAPNVKFHQDYDEDLVDAISDIAYKEGLPAGTMGDREPELDHGTMVPLYFIEKYYKDFKLVRIGLSGLPLVDHYKLGTFIARAVEQTGRRVVFVASGDLSHKLQESGPYGFTKEGPEYDDRIMDVMGRAAFGELFDFDEAFCDKAAECGHRSFVIMAGAWDGRNVRATRLSHQDVTGVGYGICTFYPDAENALLPERRFLKKYLSEKEEALQKQKDSSDVYVQLARLSLETYVREGYRIRIPEDLKKLESGGFIPDELLLERAGAFVSIHKQGKLRGCIGTISPTAQNLAKEIAQNAVSAATRDPRFDPIRPEELPWLEINVDVLGEPEDIDSISDLNVKCYGVIVSTRDGRRGLLLPDIDGVDDEEQQVAIAMSKGGIQPHEDYFLQRFEVVRHW
ncbi:MAG: AmmeMemoRadiSam system protein A [Clostridiales bacterium]|nr:AmmeMemoRadiSam system protein A [Clostridiales bacterium]